MRAGMGPSIMNLFHHYPCKLQLGSEGKRLRPTILLLMASSLAAGRPRPDMLAVDMRPPAIHVTDHRRRQQRIAEARANASHASVDAMLLPQIPQGLQRCTRACRELDVSRPGPCLGMQPMQHDSHCICRCYAS